MVYRLLRRYKLFIHSAAQFSKGQHTVKNIQLCMNQQQVGHQCFTQADSDVMIEESLAAEKN